MVPKGNGVGIVAMGVFLPDDVRTNDWWPADWRETQVAKLKYDLMASVDEAAAKGAADVDIEIRRYAGPYFADLFRGVKERRVIAADMLPSEMEARACQDALAKAGVAADRVDAVIGYSALTDIATLENSALVAHKLGLRPDVSAFSASGACTSLLHQIRVAARLVETGEFETVLTYVSNTSSAIVDYESPSSVVPGDGAVALVIGRVEPGLGYIATETSSHGEHHRAMVLARGDEHRHSRWWLAEGSGPYIVQRGDMYSGHFAGARAASVCRPTVERLFARTGVEPKDVDFFAVSQAGAWFGRALADAVGIDHSKVLGPEDHYERYGHLMSGSVALNLLLAHRLGRIKKGDLVLAYTPGLGFITAASLIRWSWEA